MMRIGLYMNDLGLHDTSREMALSGIRPLPQLELARDHVSFTNNATNRKLNVCQIIKAVNVTYLT